MTPFPYSVDVMASVEEAQAFMRRHHIRHLPVTVDGTLSGMISDRDIKLLLGPDFAYPDASELTVGSAMVQEAYAVDLETRLDVVLAHMADHHLGCALVTRKGKLAGIFTVTDACRQFSDLLRSEYRRSGGNAA